MIACCAFRYMERASAFVWTAGIRWTGPARLISRDRATSRVLPFPPRQGKFVTVTKYPGAQCYSFAALPVALDFHEAGRGEILVER